MRDISLDGVKLDGDLGIRVREASEYMSIPGTNNQIVKIPGKHGSQFLDSDLDPRPFAFDCRTRSKSFSNLQKTVRDLTTIFFDQFGKAKEVKLVLGHEPEKWYNVRYAGSVSIQKLAKFGDFILPLIAYDPYAYAPATYYDPDFIARYDTDTYYDDGITEYTNQTHTPFNNPRQYAGVFNYSHYATPFSFVIEGYVHKPKITNLTSGQSTRINVTVQEGERLYFDSKLKTTWKVKAEDDEWFWLTPYQKMKDYAYWDKVNQYNDMTGNFIELLSGGNSLLFEGGNPNAQINFNWEHRYL